MNKKNNSIFNKVVFSWALYDFANSAYALLITGVGYQIYFKKIVFVGNQGTADLAWGITVSISIVASALISPLIGVAADRHFLMKPIFILCTSLAIFFTAALATVKPGAVLWGILAFFLANFFYNLSLSIYDAYLKNISSTSNSARISGFGWGIGYLGGLLCLLITFPFFSKEPSVINFSTFQMGFIITSIFYLIWSIPAIKFLPSQSSSKVDYRNIVRIAKDSYSRAFSTLKKFSFYGEVSRFIIAFYFISEAVATTIYFTANYLSSTFGLKTKEILILTVIVQFVGFPTSLVFGYFADKWNLKKSLLISVLIWILLILVVATGRNQLSIYIYCTLLGLVIGSTQSMGRALLSNLSPTDKINEFFGFNSLSSKAAATLGPLLFGLISSWSGNQRIAWLSLLPFLFVGGLLLLKVKEDDVKSGA
jgi:MFS transporter, UMF1 family